ncbi:MAG: bifunctional metallophosphatase/5'-nucleotidase [Phycisphaerae bacterium]|nr:bifunctional metallophosphatase/5'-nucleotidase [Phycisphaerae bacterium]
MKRIAAVVAHVAGSAAALAGGPTVDFQLTILHNNDAESQLISAPGEPDFGGAARFAALVDRLRADADVEPGATVRSALVVTAGDNFLAGPEFNANNSRPAGAPFYDTIAIDLIGYDVLGVGNHEFDFGPDVFEMFLSGFSGASPVAVTANLGFGAEPGLNALVPARLAASVELNIEGKRVGVVGATTPNLPFISSPRDVTVDQAVASAIQAEVDALTASGVNIIIVTSHLQSVDEELMLATMLDDVDAIVAGGGDDIIADAGTALVPGDSIDRVGYPLTATDLDGDTVYVVSTAGDYKYVGRLILDFDFDGNVINVPAESNIVRVADLSVDPLNGVTPRQDVIDQVVTPVMDAIDELAQNVIASSDVPLDGRRNNIRSRETNLGNLIADSFLYVANRKAASFGVDAPQVAFANGGGIRNDSVLPAGDFTELDSFDVLPFTNFVTVVPNVPREQFKEILENCVSRIEAGTGAAVGDGTGRYAQVAGFEMTYDPHRQAIDLDLDGQTIRPGQRVLEVSLDDGTVVVEAGKVIEGEPIDVAIVDFLAQGGDQYPFRGLPFTNIGVTYQQALAQYIAESAGLNGVISEIDYPAGGEGRVRNLDFVPCSPADLGLPNRVHDIADVIMFLQLFGAMDPAADLGAPEGTFDIGDVMAFLDIFGAGCP